MLGQEFDRLIVEKFLGKRSDGMLLWLCKCRCGNYVEVVEKQLKRGQTRSCGCLFKDINKTHGMKGTRVYRIWAGMLDRCRNKKNKDYLKYKGKVCERWLTFENFYSDVGEPPSNNHSLDRYPDRNGNYEPGNTRWATAKEQAENRNERECLVITPEVLTRIVDLHENGWTYADIARHLKLIKSTVRRAILRNKQ